MTNRYLSLKKSNKLGLQMFLRAQPEEQIVQIVRYLKGVSWDYCGAELVCDALTIRLWKLKRAAKVSFETEEAKQFRRSQKTGWKKASVFGITFLVAPPFLFFGWGLEGLLLLWLAPQFDVCAFAGVPGAVFIGCFFVLFFSQVDS